ncbi:MAG: hypothetical protein KDK97_02155 [Verrucomicrobiales bacterium]|nr:hypothetical protein [Verrucomicrobiales bacterium]MCP5558646.1 hypothetical protein [Verrucomicrobiaceae bacterium]
MKTLFIISAIAMSVGSLSLGQEGGAKTRYDIALEAFQQAVMRSLKVKASEVIVSPVMERYQAEAPYANLRTGELWPFWALKNDGVTTLVRGFASADGQIAFQGYEAGIGQTGGLSDLLKASAILDRRKRLKPEAMAARLLWCLAPAKVGTDEQLFDAKLVKQLGWTPPKGVRKAEYHPQKTGVMLIYFTMSQGNTGTLDFHKVSVTVLPNDEMIVQREEVNP